MRSESGCPKPMMYPVGSLSFAEIWVVCSALDSFLQSHDKLKTSQ